MRDYWWLRDMQDAKRRGFAIGMGIGAPIGVVLWHSLAWWFA